MDQQLYPKREIPCSEPDKQDAVWKVGKYVFRADFDSANLHYVRQGNSNCEMQLWTRLDCQGTEYERGTRSWFHFGVSGHGPGDWVALNIMNINKQGKLFGQDYRPWFWHASMAEWQPVNSKVVYKREDEDFQLRFSFKFESAEEVFFAFAIPFSYRENQALLDHITFIHRNLQEPAPEHDRGNPPACDPAPALADGKVQKGTSNGSSCKGSQSHSFVPNQVYFKRQLLARTVEGREVDLLTITDHHGATDEYESMPPAPHRELWQDQLGGIPACPGAPTMPENFEGHCNNGEEERLGPEERYSSNPVPLFPSKKVFVITARVHPGETPASHMFNGILTFLLRQQDARAAALRRLFVFKLVPIVNPDGVYQGHYRTDTLGQNLNRYYMGQPSQELQPSVWAIKTQLSQYSERGVLEYYLDLHAHANKKGVFVYGNALDGEQAVESLLYSKLVALNSPIFDFMGCNFTEKNMSRPDKDGASKEGAGRVALFRETGLTHLYTVEANYNTARVLNLIPAASGKHNGRVSPPNTRRVSPRFTADVLQAGGRAFLVAALDMRNANPWSRLPSSAFHSLQGAKSWVMTCLRATHETRLQHLPAVSEQTEPPPKWAGSDKPSSVGPGWSVASINSSSIRSGIGNLQASDAMGSAVGGRGASSKRGFAGPGFGRAAGAPFVANARRIVSFGRTQAVPEDDVADLPGLPRNSSDRSLGGAGSRSSGGGRGAEHKADTPGGAAAAAASAAAAAASAAAAAGKTGRSIRGCKDDFRNTNAVATAEVTEKSIHVCKGDNRNSSSTGNGERRCSDVVCQPPEPELSLLGLEINGKQLGLQEQMQGRKSSSSSSGGSSSSSNRAATEAELQQGALSTGPHTDPVWPFKNGGPGLNGNLTYSHTHAVHEALLRGSSRRKSSSSGIRFLARPPSHELKSGAVVLHGALGDGGHVHTGHPLSSWDVLVHGTSLKQGKTGLMLSSGAGAATAVPATAAAASPPAAAAKTAAAGKAGVRQQNPQVAVGPGRALQAAAGGQQKLQQEGKKGSVLVGHKSPSSASMSHPIGSEKDDSDPARALSMKDRKGSFRTSLLQKPAKQSSLKLR